VCFSFRPFGVPFGHQQILTVRSPAGGLLGSAGRQAAGEEPAFVGPRQLRRHLGGGTAGAAEGGSDHGAVAFLFFLSLPSTGCKGVEGG